MMATSSHNLRRALLWKEWREQRWRGVLSAIVLMTLAGGLIRAQILSLPEASVLVFVPASILLAVFLSMGTVATEREDNTWDFLVAQPVSRKMLLRAKWQVSAAILLGSFLLATLTALLAAISRGLFILAAPPGVLIDESGFASYSDAAFRLLWGIGACLAASLAFHAVLVALLARARTELHAGIGGILLTVVAVAWMLQHASGSTPLPGGEAFWQPITRVTFALSPLSPLYFCTEPGLFGLITLALAAAWVVCSVLWIDRFAEARP